MAQTLEKLFLTKIAAMPKEEAEAPTTPKEIKPTKKVSTNSTRPVRSMSITSSTSEVMESLDDPLPPITPSTPAGPAAVVNKPQSGPGTGKSMATGGGATPAAVKKKPAAVKRKQVNSLPLWSQIINDTPPWLNKCQAF